MESATIRTIHGIQPNIVSSKSCEPHTDVVRPRVSFIVCTRNRVTALAKCIRSIVATCRRYPASGVELVVIDDGSTDETAQYVACLTSELEISSSVVSTPHRGLASARNAGIETARGCILVFVDDDCEVDRNFLADLERRYATGERAIIRGGRVELGDPADLPFTIKGSQAAERFSPDVHPGGFIHGCNMTMPYEVARRIGRFDQRFGAGGPLRAAEDTDYLVRAFLLGIPIEYVPDMVVFHHHGRKTRAAIQALHRDYSLGNGGLCMKHFRRAPWLLRHFLWAQRDALRELTGGPHFDHELHLSHWPIVFMNLLGAIRFTCLVLTRRSGTKEKKVEGTPAQLEAPR